VNGGVVERFIYQDQLEPVAKVDADGNVLELYVYGERVSTGVYIYGIVGVKIYGWTPM
jgi:hypothetical protein